MRTSIRISDEEGKAAVADVDTVQDAIGLVHFEYEQYTASQKVAVLLRRLAKVEAELATLKIKAAYNSSVAH